jgi:hypothetical protein
VKERLQSSCPQGRGTRPYQAERKKRSKNVSNTEVTYQVNIDKNTRREKEITGLLLRK